MMKQYTKPSVEVVELSVRENMAALPTAISGGQETTAEVAGKANVTLTTYNLNNVTYSIVD